MCAISSARLRALFEATQQGGDGIGGIEALVGVHLERVIRVGGHLPAAYVDRFEPRLHLLNGLMPVTAESTAT